MSLAAPLFLLYLLLMGWLLQRRTQWLTRFGIFTTLLGALFVRYGVAVPFSDNVIFATSGIRITPERLVDYYIAVTMVYACIYLGILVVDMTWQDRWFKGSGSRSGTVPLFLTAGAITALVIVAWIVIPWENFLNGALTFLPGSSAQIYRQHRVEYGAQTGYATSVLAYLGSFARFALAPGALWILFFHRRRSRALSLMFWILLATLLIIDVLSGQKQPALLLAAGFIVALLLQHGRPSVANWRLLAGAAAFVGLIVPVLYHFQYPDQDYFALVEQTIYRLTEEFSRVAQLRFVFYPDVHPHLYGQSSFVVRAVLHAVGVDTGVQSPEVFIPVNSPGAGSHYGGVWNAGFFAEAWADFGFVGVFVASVVIGAFVRAIDRWYVASGQGPLEQGTYAALCISAVAVSETATLTALWTFGLGSSFLVYLLLRSMAHKWTTSRMDLRQSTAEPGT